MTTMKDRVLDDPATRYWVRNAIQSLSDRDVVDAANDARLVADVMANEAAIVTGDYLTVNYITQGRGTDTAHQSSRAITVARVPAAAPT